MYSPHNIFVIYIEIAAYSYKIAGATIVFRQRLTLYQNYPALLIIHMDKNTAL